MKKITKRLIAGMASAVMLTGAFAAVVSAARSDTDEKPSLTSLPTPISSDPKNTDYRIFKRAKPVVKAMTNDDDRYYYYYYSYNYRVLSWEPIANALYYSVYVKYPGDKEFKHLDDTLETEFPIKDENAQYKVRPMTFSYDDKKISGAFSDPVSVRKTKKMRPVYDDNDYLEGGAVYEEEEAADAEPPMMATNSVSYASSAARTKHAGAVSGAPAPYGIPIYGNTEEYQHYDESGFKSAAQSPLSTFSADVDTASYANVRRMIKGDYSIPEDAVRIEEFINYLNYGYPAPDADNTLSVSTTLSDCPWNSKAKLLRVGVQAKELEKEPASNLVFLIDVSGSMYSQDKLPLVVESINELTRNLSSKDTISMVVYSGEERIVLAGAKGDQTNTVKTLTSMLEADGSTNGEQGINMAYDIAKKYFKKGANNRVIMATDGDLNVGISDKDELEKFIAGKAESGIYLTILGFGTDNIKDNKMEALAKEGNGNYYYIDCFEEAQKVLSEEKNGTLLTVADDVKFQVEFNPNTVSKYRLIGYDGRVLQNEDFRNDSVTAADMGAGQSVTVLYEIIPTAASSKDKGLKYQKATASKDLCTVTVRYKDGKDAKEIEKIVNSDAYVTIDQAGKSFNAAAAAAEFAISLRGSKYADKADAKHALSLLETSGTDKKNSGVKYSDDLAKTIRRYLETDRVEEDE